MVYATINNWVSKQAKRQIPSIIDKLTNAKSTAMVIVNAIAFEGQWPKGYFNVKHTKPMLFNGLKAKKSVLTMRQNNLVHYYEDDNLRQFIYPTKVLNIVYLSYCLILRKKTL